MLFIGWFPNLVVRPLRTKKNVAINKIRKALFSFLQRMAEVNVNKIVISPRSGISVFRLDIALCCCSMNVGADKSFGL
jgi:hypothetical protein